MPADERAKPATIYDVAHAAGVSHQTVSRYLRGAPGIKQANRARVEAALHELHYRPNLTARGLRKGRIGNIALSLPSLNQPYFAELAQAVVHAARDRDLAVFIETTDDNRDRELAALSQDRGALVDGAIFVPTLLDGDDLTGRALGFPIVLVGDRIVESPFDHVTMANEAAAHAAVAHLIATGRRRIAVVGVEPEERPGASHLRYRGYIRALADAGLDLDRSLIVDVGEWVRAAGVTAAEELLTRGVEFDAVFAFNDALAIGVLRGLTTAGIRVPETVALVGFDDTEDAAYATPSLTTVAAGIDEIAANAVELLVARMDGSSDPPRDIATGFHLVVRESSSL